MVAEVRRGRRHYKGIVGPALPGPAAAALLTGNDGRVGLRVEDEVGAHVVRLEVLPLGGAQ